MTKLSLTQSDGEIISIELPDSDHTAGELCDAFYRLLLGLTYRSSSIIEGMKNTVEYWEEY